MVLSPRFAERFYDGSYWTAGKRHVQQVVCRDQAHVQNYFSKEGSKVRKKMFHVNRNKIHTYQQYSSVLISWTLLNISTEVWTLKSPLRTRPWRPHSGYIYDVIRSRHVSFLSLSAPAWTKPRIPAWRSNRTATTAVAAVQSSRPTLVNICRKSPCNVGWGSRPKLLQYRRTTTCYNICAINNIIRDAQSMLWIMTAGDRVTGHRSFYLLGDAYVYDFTLPAARHGVTGVTEVNYSVRAEGVKRRRHRLKCIVSVYGVTRDQRGSRRTQRHGRTTC